MEMLRDIKSESAKKRNFGTLGLLASLLVRFRILLFWVLILLLFVFSVWGRVFIKTILLIPSVWPDAKIKPLDIFSKEPIKEELQVESNGEKIKVDVYRPNDNKRHPSIILSVIGVTPDSNLVVNYIKGFARVGFVVAVPKVEHFYKVEGFYYRFEDIDYMVNTFKLMEKNPYVDSSKMGFFGLCTGGTYALTASEKKEISERVNFVIAVSPWFTAGKIFRALYVNQYEEGGQIKRWIPEAGAIEPTTRSVIHFFAEKEERVLLEEIINGTKPKEKLPEISPMGRRIYDFVTNRDPNKYDEFASYIPWATYDMNRISPSSEINNLKAKVYVITDRKDRFVPHTESEDLKNSLPAGQVRKTDLELLEHTQLSRRLPRLPTVVDLVKLTFFTWRMLIEIGLT